MLAVEFAAAAMALNETVRTVERKAKDGRLPTVLVNGRRLIDKNGLDFNVALKVIAKATPNDWAERFEQFAAALPRETQQRMLLMMHDAVMKERVRAAQEEMSDATS